MGLSLNPSSVEEVDDVMKELQAQKSVVQAYVMDEIFDKMEAAELPWPRIMRAMPDHDR